jgi:2-C-methyl-D-erythritol 4-phosphate cytidylyltransferase
MSASLIAIVPAAGVGRRALGASSDGIPKQYRPLAGQAMLWHSVRALLSEPRIEEVHVAVSPDDGWVESALAGLPRTVWRPCGGATRSDTVANTLADIGAADDTWVLVHDAARPGLPTEALGRLVDACLADPVGGLLALPVRDTVKAGRHHVVRTLDRGELWLAQTPQMFRAGMLARALRHAAERGIEITDEASAMEADGHAPLLVPGASRNFKVTWPEDFELMEKWL